MTTRLRLSLRPRGAFRRSSSHAAMRGEIGSRAEQRKMDSQQRRIVELFLATAL
jgi:hypothetical protein